MTDLLILTALTEEAQVVRAVLDAVATPIEDGDVRLYDYACRHGRTLRVGVASAHQMGAVTMGVFAAPLLRDIRPRSATLVGIAASVGQSTVELGDVPFSSHVLSYDDIAVEQGILTFRTEGFQVDPAMRRAVGELRTSLEHYVRWRDSCRGVMHQVVSTLNQLRRTEMQEPEEVLSPHLIVDVTAGGPFLLRDRDFRDSLRKPPKTPSYTRIKVTAPLHPKLVSVEMESHGFMRAAHEHGVPATVLKGISDVGDDGKATLENRTGGFFRAYACSNAVLAALHILGVRDRLDPARVASSRASQGPQMSGLVTFEDWSRYPAYATPLERTAHVERRIAALRDLLHQPEKKIFRVRPSESRFVIEALRSNDLARRVFYVDLHGERTQIATKLVSFRSEKFEGILVVDNCPYGEYLSLKTEAEHPDSKILVIALASHPDQEAARKLLEERLTVLEGGDYEKALELAEQAVRLARQAEDREGLTLALRCAIVDMTDFLAAWRPDEADKQRLIERIRTHISEIETLEASGVRVLLEKASLAQIEGKAEDAFRFAEMAIASAKTLQIEVEATLFCLRASWHVGMIDRGLCLRERVAELTLRLEAEELRLRECAVERPRRLEAEELKMMLSADWLSTLSRAGTATSEDVSQFVSQAAGCTVTSKAITIVGQLVREFGRASDFGAVRVLLQMALRMAIERAEPLPIVNILLDLAGVDAELENATDAIQQLGAARAWVDKLTLSGANGNWASAMANTLRTTGRIFSRLADKVEESDYRRAIELRRAAHRALSEAVDFSREHAAEISGPVGAFRSELDAALGSAAAELGRNAEAAQMFRRARTEQVMSDAKLFEHIGAKTYLDEARALFLGGRVAEARSLLAHVVSRPSMPGKVRQIAKNTLEMLDRSVVPVVDWLASDAARNIGNTAAKSGLRYAVAELTRPLGDWIEELSSSGAPPFAGLFDQWGRGGFARLVAAVRADPLNAVSVDATCIEDIERMARIFCPLYDTVIVSWKGPLEGKMALFPVSGSASNCGIGYTVVEERDGRLGLGGWANLLPDSVATYLGTTALPLIISGRLVVVPAPLVGCTQTVVGWTDNLLVDNLFGGVVKSVKKAEPGHVGSADGDQSARDLGALMLPTIAGIPLGILGTILDDSAEWLSPLRRLLRTSIGSNDVRHERWGRLGTEVSDLRDALRHLDEKWDGAVRAAGAADGRVLRIAGSFSAVRAPEDSPGTELLTSFVRAIAGPRSDLGPWVPFWRLHNMGATIDWIHPLDNQSTPAPRVVVQSGLGIDPNKEGWLYPGQGGPHFRASVWGDAIPAR